MHTFRLPALSLYYPSVFAALVLIFLSVKNYFMIMIRQAPPSPPAWLLLFSLLAVRLIITNCAGYIKSRLRYGLNLLTLSGVVIGIVNMATETVFSSLYQRILAVPPTTLITASDLRSLAATLLLAPTVLIGLGALVILYYAHINPGAGSRLKPGSLSCLRSRVSKSGKPDLCLCIDKKTGGQVIIPHHDLFRHLLVLGPTGCGKTSLFLIPLAHQLVQNGHTSLLAMDPKGDFARYVGAMCHYYGRPYVLFDPARSDCPFFNPLAGEENDVVENMVTTLDILADENVRYFQDQNARLLRNGVRLLKRLYGDDANLLLLNDLFHNRDGFGQRCLAQLSQGPVEPFSPVIRPDTLRQNREIISYFRDDYFSPHTKTFDHTSGVRNQIANLTDNIQLRRALNPPAGQKPDIDFSRLLQEGGVVSISLAQGQLRGLARYLGLFLQMSYQSAVFRRPGLADRLPAYEIIDEIQVIANGQFAEMVQQARSLECAVIAATQGLEQLALHLGSKGRAFLAALKTNFQNRVIFAGLSPEDARLFSDWSGLKPEQKVTRGLSTGAFDPWATDSHRRGPVKSRTVTEQEKPVFNPDEVMYLNAREVLYFISRHMQLERPRTGVARWLPERLHRKFQDLAEAFWAAAESPVSQPRAADREKAAAGSNPTGFSNNATETDELLS